MNDVISRLKDSFARFDPKMHRYLAWMWLAVCMLLLLSLWWLLPRSQINSSVLDLLPESEIEGVPPVILERFKKRLDQQLIWLISPRPTKDANNLAAVEWWQQQLKKIPEIAKVSGEMSLEKQDSFGRFFFAHRQALLDNVTQGRLESGTQADWILGQIYSPFSGISTLELKNDPLLLIRGIQLGRQINSPLQLNQNWLSSKDSEGRTWYLVRAELQASSYNIKTAAQTVQKLNALKTELQTLWPNSEILQRGTIFYSDYASQQAQRDMSTIGVVSLIGTISLLLCVFRSFKPLWLTLLSISAGILGGFVMVLVVFGQIHVITLVMSTSVVGISIDYALHYLTERMVQGQHESPLASLKNIFPALFIALLSSVLAYLLLYITPFPGLQQLAVFAGFGLTAAFMTVVCWYPILVKRLPNRKIPFLSCIEHILHCWQYSRALRLGLPLAILCLIVIGLIHLKIDDDIRSLQTLPEDLQTQTQKIVALTGQYSDQKWFIVYGDTPQETLERLEKLTPALEQARVAQQLKQYRDFPLPSLKKQKENQLLIKEKTPLILARLEQAGIAMTEISSHALTQDSGATLLTEQDWLESVASEGWRLLYLSTETGKTAILIPVEGVTDSAAMKQIATANSGVHWVDKRTEFSEIFTTYRNHLTQLLAVAILGICGIFLLRFGLVRGLRCAIPTVFSVGMGVAILGLLGQSLNLFSLLALILVLGIGIDYTLFFSNARIAPTTTLFSVLLAALTTLLSFGLLALSHTQAIAGFGLVLTGGILTAFLLAPLVIPFKNSVESK